MSNKKTMEQAEFLYQTITALKMHLVKRMKHRPETVCCDLTMPQSNAMLIIRQHGARTIRQLAEGLGVAPPSASTMVDRLVEMGMLRRESSQADRRVVNVLLTGDGEKALAEMEKVMLGVFADLLAYMGPCMADQWLKVLKKVRAWMDEQDRAPDGEVVDGKESGANV